jgi:hypothetical protein
MRTLRMPFTAISVKRIGECQAQIVLLSYIDLYLAPVLIEIKT